MRGMARVAALEDPDAVPGRPDWVSVNVMRHGTEYTVDVTGSYASVINRFPIQQPDGTRKMRAVLAHSTKHSPLTEQAVLDPGDSLESLMHAVAWALHQAFEGGCPDEYTYAVDELGTPPLF